MDPKVDIKEKLFPKSALFEAYGSTEAGLITLLRVEPESYSQSHTCGAEVAGMPLQRIVDKDGIDVRPGETGELLARTPMMFQAYHNNTAMTRKNFTDDGYFHTGDIVQRDCSSGALIVKGREDGLICLGHGWNVWPSEVEETIEANNVDTIKEAIVIPRTTEGGVIAAALLIPRHHGNVLSEEDLVESIVFSLKGRLSSFKHPKMYAVLKDASFIPRSLNQKVQAERLREILDKNGEDVSRSSAELGFRWHFLAQEEN